MQVYQYIGFINFNSYVNKLVVYFRLVPPRMKSKHSLPNENLFTFRDPQTESNTIKEGTLAGKLNYAKQERVPLKEYSNKFLREACPFDMSSKPGVTQRKKSIALRGKYLLQKCYHKQNFRHSQQVKNLLQPNEEGCQPGEKLRRLNKKVRTEMAPLDDNTELLSQTTNLLISSSFGLKKPTSNSYILNSSAASCPQNPERRPLAIKKIQEIENISEQKISQSRGLQLFSKLYVRNNFEMVQKARKKSDFLKVSSSRAHSLNQNFDIRRVTVLQESNKRQALNQRYGCKKKFQPAGRNEDFRQFTQLRGWETAN